VFNDQLYIPRIAVINDVCELTHDTRLLRLRFRDCRVPAQDGDYDYKPGQFVQVSILGAGEVPVSICSSPTGKDSLELCVRRAGHVTSAVSVLGEGDELGLRGPYGNGFSVARIRQQPLLFVAGGIGLAPLRSLIGYVMDNRDDFGRVTILYGAKTKQDIVFGNELKQWAKARDTDVAITVDRPQEGWDGHTGVVTSLFGALENASACTAFVCGPPIMIHFALIELLDMGLKPNRIITTLERHMKCGVGKCGHCYLKGQYVCTDGPVFSYEQLDVMNVRL
jgi:NAD(P)H-flavin reductase